MIKARNQVSRRPVNTTQSFAPVLLTREGEFCFYLAEKNVAGTGATIEEAYAQYEMTLQELEVKQKKYGFIVGIEDPHPTKRYSSLLQDLLIFGIKVVLGVSLAIYLTIAALPVITVSIEHQISNLEEIITHRIPEKLFSERFWLFELPQRLNDKFEDLTPSDQETLRKEWETLFERIPRLPKGQESSL